jgi:2-polyprenyl-3-methyl-5-hydroxy-6-metoxy-1,4-benzoquinol methylase/glycosyltransferase involved in cell wall biosynthesis
MNSATRAATRIGNFRTFPVSRELNPLATSTDANVLSLVGKNKRVLELGCGAGHMSRALREQGCTVVGIEIHPEAAQKAASICERVIVEDLDYLNFERELGTDRFDVVLAADVLEHLKDPLFILQTIKQFVLPRGYVVISVPNVAHISVRLALLAGKFPYGETGLLDQTHIRFLTRESIEQLMEDADLAIGHFERITNLPDQPPHFEVPYDPTVLPPSLVEQLLHDPEALTYQFVLSGYPLAEPGLIFIRERIKALAHEVENSRQEVARLQEICKQSESTIESLQKQLQDRTPQADEQTRVITGLKVQVETLLMREKDLRDMLLEAHDQLLKRDEEISLTVASALSQTQPPPLQAGAPAAPAQAGGKYLAYQQVIHKIRELVRSRIPGGGNVLVVSKGDDDLLRLDPCQAAHFPQREDGRYAGYYPANGAAAVEHLQELQHRGSQFLLIPQTALWWLDHYRELADYLNSHCVRIIDEPDACVVFDIASAKKKPETPVLHTSCDGIASARPFGVNVWGNITSEKGVGEAVRGQTRSFLAAGVPVALNNVFEDTAVNLVDEFTDFSDDNPYAVNLIHLNADALLDFVELNRDCLPDRYNIGFWAWETSTFPNEWWDRFQYLDEIWVGSDFVLDAISRVSPIPVIKTPLAVPNRSSLSPHSRSHFGLRNKTFVFLFAFDYMSIFERKNPLALIQAFRKAFSLREDVMLVLKCAHSEAHPYDANVVKQACQQANIKIIDGVTSRAEVNSLMHAADCYVSLHRSEGFGLTMAEAMSLGKPVIATGYSGNMEFMSQANSYPVKYKLTAIEAPQGPYREGHWADPDVDHAAELMRFVFDNRDEAKTVGRRARTDILRNLSPAATGAVMRNRLLRIAGFGKISAPGLAESDSPKSSSNGFYGHLVERIHQIVETNVPSDGRVVVVSKGDDNLLTFPFCDGWHFPQDSEGKYAGYYPANDSEAIGHLEALRGKGGEYLLLPQTAFWWLDHYSQLRTHLEAQYRRVWSNNDCIIYELAKKSNGNGIVARFRERIAKRTY